MTAIGHLSTGLLLKGRCPRAPLPLLLIAAALPDVLWAFFNLLRHPGRAPLEVVQISNPFMFIGDQHLVLQPWSHSLTNNLGLALGVAALVFLAYRDRQVAVTVGLAVFGHWLLDFLVHDADLPLGPWTESAVVGPPFVLDAEHPGRGLFSVHPLLGFALQTTQVVVCGIVLLRAYPVAGARGRLKMLAGLLVLSAPSLLLFSRGWMSSRIDSSTALLVGAVVEMLVLGLALHGLARWSLGPAVAHGPLDGPPDEAVLFVHRLMRALGVAALLIAAVYLGQSMLDARFAPSVGWGSIGLCFLFVELGRRLMAMNPSALWLAAFSCFIAGPLVRVLTTAGNLGPFLVVLEMAMGAATVWLISTLLRRNLAL